MDTRSPRRIVIDSIYQVIEVDGWRRIGECLRCGKCCEQNRPMCQHYRSEKHNGVPVKRCLLHGPNKPVSCAVWPLHDSPDVPEGCGIYWEVI